MRNVFAIVAVIAATGPSPARAADVCTDNWSSMAGTVSANGLTPAKDLQQLAATRVPGKLIKISLCGGDYGFRYQLVFLDAAGQLVTLRVDARNPFPQ
jgi:hypothetical protein